MDLFAYYIVLTMSWCINSEGSEACEPREDTYYFSRALHCEQVRREMSVMYDEFYSNVTLKGSSCRPMIVELDNKRMPMWDSHDHALEAARSELANALKILDGD